MQQNGQRFVVLVYDPILNQTSEQTDGLVYPDDIQAEQARQAWVRHTLADDATRSRLIVGGRVEEAPLAAQRTAIGNSRPAAMGAGQGMVLDGSLAPQTEQRQR